MFSLMRNKVFQATVFVLLFGTFVAFFLFADASGLIGGAPLTPGTTVATVNGRDITYQVWQNTVESLRQDEERRLGRSITLDERARLEQQALDQIVGEILLEEEYTRRGISATNAEIVEAARYSPPPQLLQAPELQTDGQFDIEKYQRYLASPQARQSGLLLQLESYYRNEIKQRKLFDQIAGDVYVTDARLWNIWQDTRDSAQVSYVAWRPELIGDSAVTVSDADLRAWYERNREELERPGRAAVSVVAIPRIITAADTAATRARLERLRAEIVGGTPFEDVARRESVDSLSAVEGGALPRGPRGRFVAPFENAVAALAPGELSQPVLTQFGYHLIRLDERKADTLAIRHILIPIAQSDSSATVTDRQADRLANLASGATDPARFDSAARAMGLEVRRAQVFEGEPLTLDGVPVPDVSAWAFSGPAAGESSELFSSDDAYYLARLDTIVAGGVPPFEDARDLIRQELVQRAKIDSLVPRAREFARAAAASSLEQAAQGRNLAVQQTPLFSRVSTVPGLGQLTQPIGAAFGLPVGAISAPITAPQGVYVLRVDRRLESDRAAFEAQKGEQREQLTQALRQRRVQDYLQSLRRAAEIEDNRKEVQQMGRATQEG